MTGFLALEAVQLLVRVGHDSRVHGCGFLEDCFCHNERLAARLTRLQYYKLGVIFQTYAIATVTIPIFENV